MINQFLKNRRWGHYFRKYSQILFYSSNTTDLVMVYISSEINSLIAF